MRVRQYRRGDVLLADLPFADITGSKVRPVVVVQNDIANKVRDHLIVVAISSKVPSRLVPTQYLVRRTDEVARQAGLIKDSVVDCSVIYTISKRRIVRKVGSFPPEAMAQIDRCLKISLALE